MAKFRDVPFPSCEPLPLANVVALHREALAKTPYKIRFDDGELITSFDHDVILPAYAACGAIPGAGRLDFLGRVFAARRGCNPQIRFEPGPFPINLEARINKAGSLVATWGPNGFVEGPRAFGPNGKQILPPMVATGFAWPNFSCVTPPVSYADGFSRYGRPENELLYVRDARVFAFNPVTGLPDDPEQRDACSLRSWVIVLAQALVRHIHSELSKEFSVEFDDQTKTISMPFGDVATPADLSSATRAPWAYYRTYTSHPGNENPLLWHGHDVSFFMREADTRNFIRHPSTAEECGYYVRDWVGLWAGMERLDSCMQPRKPTSNLEPSRRSRW